MGLGTGRENNETNEAAILTLTRIVAPNTLALTCRATFTPNTRRLRLRYRLPVPSYPPPPPHPRLLLRLGQ